jgi:hypothetical protein
MHSWLRSCLRSKLLHGVLAVQLFDQNHAGR